MSCDDSLFQRWVLENSVLAVLRWQGRSTLMCWITSLKLQKHSESTLQLSCKNVCLFLPCCLLTVLILPPWVRHIQMFVCSFHRCWPQKVSGSGLLMCRLISASILGPVFGNQDQFLGLALFLDTFRNDLHGMDVSVQCVTGGHWWACFFAGPVFSNNAHFHGLAVFIDTYSNDEAMDVSGCSGSSCQHAV